MKTAISIPDAVFRKAEKLAKRLKKSRSRLYAEAVAEYVARRSPSELTEAYDLVAERVDSRVQKPFAAASRRTLLNSEW
jgi:metal-responsive CopG/Arc/MetJ family transcriptional regulator